MKIYINSYRIFYNLHLAIIHYGLRPIISLTLRGKLSILFNNGILKKFNLNFSNWNYFVKREDGVIKILDLKKNVFLRSRDSGKTWTEEIYKLGRKYNFSLKDTTKVCQELEHRILNYNFYKPHGDISPNNILIYKNRTLFIDDESIGYGSLEEDYITFLITIQESLENINIFRKIFRKKIYKYILFRVRKFFNYTESEMKNKILKTCQTNIKTWETIQRELGITIWKETLIKKKF